MNIHVLRIFASESKEVNDFNDKGKFWELLSFGWLLYETVNDVNYLLYTLNVYFMYR